MNTLELSNFFQKTMGDAAIEAQNLGHVVIHPEHVFAAMCKDITIHGTLRDAGFDSKTLPGHVYKELEKRKGTPQSSHADGPAIDHSHSLQMILQHASRISDIAPMVNHLAMLDALAQSSTPIGDVLRELGVDDHKNRTTQLRDASSPNQPAAAADRETTRQTPQKQTRTRRAEVQPAIPAYVNDDDEDLPDFCTNLNALVRSGKIEEAIARDAEIEEVEDTLLQRKKKNPLLVGHAGVGKTAIVHGLAWRIVHGQVSHHLKHKKIYAINAASLTGDTKHRGDFEKKFGDLLKKAASDPNIILFLDETHTFMGLGAVGEGGTDASNMLKTYMDGGDISVIGSTTIKEEKVIRRDAAMDRRFNTVKVPEPTLQNAIKMVSGAISGYEEFHGVTYSPALIKGAAALTNRYIAGIKMPDSIFGVLDAAGVARKKRMNGNGAVTIQDVRTVISNRSGIDVKSLGKSDLEKLSGLDAALRNNIIGQDEAITVLADAARMALSPLRDPGKPISFLLKGPTGVGKTESVRQLADTLGMPLIRIDMSEMMESHSISKLIGSPPGYVGYGEGGLLTDAVDEKPHSIVLLDEVEKAHPLIWNIMLQILDHGFTNDSEGNAVNFRNTIIVMTTNAGLAEIKKTMGFTAAKDSQEEQNAQNAKGIFTSELNNRFDGIVTYRSLPQEATPAITDKFLRAAQTRMDELSLKLKCEDSARQYLIKHGFSTEFGARPMKRLIENEIMHKVNKAFIDGLLKKKGIVTVSFNEASSNPKAPLQFEFSNPGPKAPIPKAA